MWPALPLLMPAPVPALLRPLLFQLGCLVIRKNSDVTELQVLLNESTLYDKQWKATWAGKVRPSETEKA